MEVTQFTYFQQVGGIDCDPVSGELTYGLERLAMYVQGVENVYDLDFNGVHGASTLWRRVPAGRAGILRVQFRARRHELLFRHFADAESECRHAPGANMALALPAYDQCLKASHLFNLLDARGVDQRHRAAGLYRPRARAGQGLRRSLARCPRRAARPDG